MSCSRSARNLHGGVVARKKGRREGHLGWWWRAAPSLRVQMQANRAGGGGGQIWLAPPQRPYKAAIPLTARCARRVEQGRDDLLLLERAHLAPPLGVDQARHRLLDLLAQIEPLVVAARRRRRRRCRHATAAAGLLLRTGRHAAHAVAAALVPRGEPRDKFAVGEPCAHELEPIQIVHGHVRQLLRAGSGSSGPAPARAAVGRLQQLARGVARPRWRWTRPGGVRRAVGGHAAELCGRRARRRTRAQHLCLRRRALPLGPPELRHQLRQLLAIAVVDAANTAGATKAVHLCRATRALRGGGLVEPRRIGPIGRRPKPDRSAPLTDVSMLERGDKVTLGKALRDEAGGLQLGTRVHALASGWHALASGWLRSARHENSRPRKVERANQRTLDLVDEASRGRPAGVSGLGPLGGGGWCFEHTRRAPFGTAVFSGGLGSGIRQSQCICLLRALVEAPHATACPASAERGSRSGWSWCSCFLK